MAAGEDGCFGWGVVRAAGTRCRGCGSRGPCKLRALVGTVEAEVRPSGRKRDSCYPAAACSFFVNVTREDVGFLYFSMI